MDDCEGEEKENREERNEEMVREGKNPMREEN
jgi:hypothetical protein